MLINRYRWLMEKHSGSEIIERGISPGSASSIPALTVLNHLSIWGRVNANGSSVLGLGGVAGVCMLDRGRTGRSMANGPNHRLRLQVI